MHGEMVLFERIERPVESSVRYEFRNDMGWRWLQRACFWVLRKIGARAMEIAVDHTTRKIDGQRLLDRVLRSYEGIMQYLEQDQEFALVIGTEEHAQIMAETRSNQEYFYDATAIGGLNGRPAVFGMTIYVVPWFRGYCVLPRRMISPHI